VKVKTFADWQEQAPGETEMDFVVHCGGMAVGEKIHSLVQTDVFSGWTEAVPLLAREQSLVVEGLLVLAQQFPIPIRGINSDNDSAFINDTLIAYCREQQIEFTRARPYKSNDQAWIEQKNGAVIRRFVGQERFSGLVAGQTLAKLYQSARLYVNYFQPSFKLLSKHRDGSKLKRIIRPPQTPCDRLLADPRVSDESKSSLQTTKVSSILLNSFIAFANVNPRWPRCQALLRRGPLARVSTSFWRNCPGFGKRARCAPLTANRPQEFGAIARDLIPLIRFGRWSWNGLNNNLM
jgi:hypothetical protein